MLMRKAAGGGVRYGNCIEWQAEKEEAERRRRLNPPSWWDRLMEWWDDAWL